MSDSQIETDPTNASTPSEAEAASLTNVRFPREELVKNFLASLDEHEPATDEPTMAENLIRDALRERASDSHIDPQSDTYRVRFRIDGIMRDATLISHTQGDRLINQVKAVADIDPGRMFLPEEARSRYVIDNRDIDLRVALAPCLAGPKMTARVLDTTTVEQRIRDLGLSDAHTEQIERWMGGMSGMFLTTGPTNSGKTTTLYALLHELKLLDRAIITIEDPIEYQIDNVNQIEVDESHNLTFARGIRVMLRLDPDYLMVGEIRDADSAHAAMDVATRGRSVMSTLHSRDAVSAVTALRMLELADHEFAETLSFVVAQRLVRTLCLHCRQRTEANEEDRRWLQANDVPQPSPLWKPVGCEHCHHTGYAGRTGVFEVWHLDEDDYQRILNHADEHSLRNALQERGHTFLIDDAMSKVELGMTTVEEVRGLGLFGHRHSGVV